MQKFKLYTANLFIFAEFYLFLLLNKLLSLSPTVAVDVPDKRLHWNILIHRGEQFQTWL